MSRTADPGLQPQRTELAWRRTGAVMAVDALLILRAGVVGADAGALVLGVVACAFALGFIVLGLRRRRQLAQPDAGAPRASVMLAAACGMAACALATAWLLAR